MKDLLELWRCREVLWNIIRRNLKVRYKNSFLGFFWSLLNPLLQIGVWWFVFGIILNNRIDTNQNRIILISHPMNPSAGILACDPSG